MVLDLGGGGGGGGGGGRVKRNSLFQHILQTLPIISDLRFEMNDVFASVIHVLVLMKKITNLEMQTSTSLQQGHVNYMATSAWRMADREIRVLTFQPLYYLSEIIIDVSFISSLTKWLLFYPGTINNVLCTEKWAAEHNFL